MLDRYPEALPQIAKACCKCWTIVVFLMSTPFALRAAESGPDKLLELSPAKHGFLLSYGFGATNGAFFLTHANTFDQLFSQSEVLEFGAISGVRPSPIPISSTSNNSGFFALEEYPGLSVAELNPDVASPIEESFEERPQYTVESDFAEDLSAGVPKQVSIRILDESENLAERAQGRVVFSVFDESDTPVPPAVYLEPSFLIVSNGVASGILTLREADASLRFHLVGTFAESDALGVKPTPQIQLQGIPDCDVPVTVCRSIRKVPFPVDDDVHNWKHPLGQSVGIRSFFGTYPNTTLSDTLTTQFIASQGAPVYAAKAGRIATIRPLSDASGSFRGTKLTLDHGNGYRTVYYGVTPSVCRLQNVAAGDRIGVAGCVGTGVGFGLQRDYGDSRRHVWVSLNPIDPTTGRFNFSPSLIPADVEPPIATVLEFANASGKTPGVIVHGENDDGIRRPGSGIPKQGFVLLRAYDSTSGTAARVVPYQILATPELGEAIRINAPSDSFETSALLPRIKDWEGAIGAKPGYALYSSKTERDEDLSSRFLFWLPWDLSTYKNTFGGARTCKIQVFDYAGNSSETSLRFGPELSISPTLPVAGSAFLRITARMGPVARSIIHGDKYTLSLDADQDIFPVFADTQKSTMTLPELSNDGDHQDVVVTLLDDVSRTSAVDVKVTITSKIFPTLTLRKTVSVPPPDPSSDPCSGPKPTRFAEALDSRALEWHSTTWKIIAAPSAVGCYAVTSGQPEKRKANSIQTSVTGPGVLTFRWRAVWDRDTNTLKFYDGDNLVSQTGTAVENLPDFDPRDPDPLHNLDPAWHVVTYRVGSGTHTLRWSMEMGTYSGRYLNAGWLDAVRFTPSN